jgi:hypothetical protein
VETHWKKELLSHRYARKATRAKLTLELASRENLVQAGVPLYLSLNREK